LIGNDDHPPHDVNAGQHLIATVYNAIRSNVKLWRETLLVVLYDEHGGFYDHVSPPATIPPGGDIDMKEWTFDSLGLRVPAILISPYVKQGVFSEPLEHSSLLRFLIERFELDQLTDRTRAAGSFASAITSQYRDTPEHLPLGPFRHRIELDALNELQKALVRTAEWADALIHDRKYASTSHGEDTEAVERTAEDYQRASERVAEMLAKNV
jgi:hypothetical protein